jgi:uncharacterized peroxidase-related enzyme
MSTSRIALTTAENAPEKSKPVLAELEGQLGLVPNLFKLLAISPASLDAVRDLQKTLGRTLNAKTRDRIHIMTAEVNGCDYCLSAHTYLGDKLSKLTAEDMEQARYGHSTDPKADVALQFAYKVAQQRGHVDADDIDAVRAAGYTDAQIVDIVTSTAFSFMTNLFNNMNLTDIDAEFPVIHTNYKQS